MKRLVPAMMIPLLSISLPLWQPTGPLNCASCALAQEAPRQGSAELTPSILKENGCPVEIVSAKALLDFNSFGTPARPGSSGATPESLYRVVDRVLKEHDVTDAAINEREAQARGVACEVTRYPLQDLDRAIAPNRV